MRAELRTIRAVARVTFWEIVQDKVLYNVVLCAVALLALSLLAGEFAVIIRERVLVDFGLSALSISSAMIGVFVGSSLIPREFERRTALVALSRPVSRLQFVAGKFVGVTAVIGVNWLGLVGVFVGILAVSADSPLQAVVSGALVWSVFFSLLHAVLLAALTLFFSTFTTTSLTVILTLGLFAAGHNVSQVRWLAGRFDDGVFRLFLETAAYVLPNLEYFDLGTKVSYGLPVSWQYGLTAVAYGLIYVSALVVLAGYLIRVRER